MPILHSPFPTEVHPIGPLGAIQDCFPSPSPQDPAVNLRKCWSADGTRLEDGTRDWGGGLLIPACPFGTHRGGGPSRTALPTALNEMLLQCLMNVVDTLKPETEADRDSRKARVIRMDALTDMVLEYRDLK